VDAHEYPAAGLFLKKFNALQSYDVLLEHATTVNAPEFMTKAALEWYRQPLLKALDDEGLTQEWYYTTSAQPDDLRVSMGGARPDTSRNVNGLKNAVSLLLATRGSDMGRAHIQRRVHAQVTALTSVLRSTVERAENLEQVRSFVARDTAAQACHGEEVIEAAPTTEQRELTMLDPATGANRPVRVDWDSWLTPRPLRQRARPCGYWLAASATNAVDRLKLLGLQVMRVAEPGSVLAETYQQNSSDGAAPQPAPITPMRSAIDVPAGSYFVSLNQPLANLAVAALEPDAPGSYFAGHVIANLADSARVVAPASLVFEETD
jgi:hypothetical protein